MWEMTSLGNVYDVRDGTHDSPKYQDTGFPLITSKNLKNGNITFKKAKFISKEDYISINKRSKVDSGDVLFAMIGTIGNPVLIRDEPSYAIKNVALFKIPDTQSGAFLKHYLDSDFVINKMQKEAKGTTQKFVGLGYLRNFPISLPPLPEQKRIVAILDQVFEGINAAIANTQKNLSNARQLFANYQLNLLQDKKWEWKKLDALCHKVEYGSSAKSKKKGEIPVLRMGNIQNGHLDWKKLVYTDNKDEIEKYLLKHNDVLFNRTNSPELVGKTAIYKSEMPAVFAGYLIRIQRKEELLDGDYLNYFLNSQIALDYGKTVVISSVNQANINGTKLKGYPIPAPSLSEQRIIVKKLDNLQEQTENLETIYLKKLDFLNELKQSLLAKAFSGELTAQPQKVIKEAIG